MNKIKFLFVTAVLTLIFFLANCSAPEKTITSLSYDPPGATITTDKEINSQHYRTISFSNSSVFVSNEFEGARLNDFYQVDDSTYTAVIEPENAPINDSPWYSFKIWSNKKQLIRLNLTYKDGTHRYKPKISYDGKNWQLYDTTKVFVDTVANIATIFLDISSDTLWISAQELITSSYYENWIKKLSRSEIIKNNVIGNSAIGKPINEVIIGDTANGNYIFIIGRNHPPEVTGFFALKSFVETIAGESEIAEKFRSNFTTVVVPLMNPDGVDYGHWRHNAHGVDLNRDWVNFNQPEPRTVKNEVEKLISEGKKIVFFIDFHSTQHNVFYTLSLKSLIDKDLPEERNTKRKSAYGLVNKWLENLQSAVPDYHVNIFDSLSSPTSPTSDRWIMREYDVPGLTYEVGDETNRDLIRKVAEAASKELMKLLLNEAKKE